MKHMFRAVIVFTNVCIMTMPQAAQITSRSDQLTDNDVNTIVALLGGEPSDVQNPSASAPVPTITSSSENGTAKPLNYTSPPVPLDTTLVHKQLPSQEPAKQKIPLLSADETTALLNLFLSSSSKDASPQKPVKQQDFSSFTNAEPALDASANNQLNQLGDILNLVGSLGSLAGPAASLFSLGGQANPLAGLSGILGLGASQLKSKAPELMSSLGNLATLVKGAVKGPADGKPQLRGVDTRVGIGYRMGENADAQMVFEIGPQLFTEPMTQEQRNQLLLQQQQQRILQFQRQQQQLQKRNEPTRRLQTVQKRHLTTKAPAWRRNDSAPQQHPIGTAPNRVASSATSASEQRSRTTLQSPKRASASTIIGVPAYSFQPVTRPPVDPNSRSVIMLVLNGDQRDSGPISVQPYPVTRRNDEFSFIRDNSNNYARVRVLPRKSLRNRQVIHIMEEDDDDEEVITVRKHVRPTLQKRMDFYDSSYDDYDYVNVKTVVAKPVIRKVRRQRRRHQYAIPKQQLQRRSSDAKPVGKTVGETLSDWNEKNSFYDLFQNYVVDKILNEGNNAVKKVRMSGKKKQ